MPSDKERMAAKRAGIAAWNSGGPGGGNTFPLEFAIDAAIDALSAAEKEREGHRADCYWLRSTPAVDGDEAACCSCGAVERAEREGETHNGVCLRCGSGVLASGEHIRTDLPPCGREGDIIEKLREWARNSVEVDGARPRGGVAYEAGANWVLNAFIVFLNDLQKQSTGAVGEGDGTSPGEEQ